MTPQSLSFRNGVVGIFLLLVVLTLTLIFWPRKTKEEELAGDLVKKVCETGQEIQFFIEIVKQPGKGGLTVDPLSSYSQLSGKPMGQLQVVCVCMGGLFV